MDEEKQKLLNIYNGWTNYQTWNVFQWLTNDEASYEKWKAKASKYSINTLADILKERIERDIPLSKPGIYTDLLTYAISCINYYEISKALHTFSK